MAIRNSTLVSVPPLRKAPLHERIGWLGSFRGRVRNALFRFLGKLANTDDAKKIQVASLRNLLPRRLNLVLLPDHRPYPDLGHGQGISHAVERRDVILITARFRSGSTALWNLFRHLDGFTSYYEPFNERRWFDPALRGEHTDPTHRNVDDYWREYEGLGELAAHYQDNWIDQNLYMDAHSWNPAMKRFVEILIDRAPGRPVLQFNRIDFRLPWFRHSFPNAKLVHLYRHPRDQWCSSLGNPQAVPQNLRVADFIDHDHYYLLSWARDLKYYFPFLDETLASHPYQLFYFIWKLSYLFGRVYAHYSLAFEDLTANPQKCLEDLCQELNIPDAPINRLARLVEQPRSGRWRNYASDAWFQAHETHCEGIITEFFGPSAAPAASRL